MMIQAELTSRCELRAAVPFARHACGVGAQAPNTKEGLQDAARKEVSRPSPCVCWTFSWPA